MLVKYRIIMKFFLISLTLIISGCASQPENIESGPGFFVGIWHGLVALPSVVIGLFTSIRIYNFPNSGYWYDVGFILGFIISIFILFVWLEESNR
jgi:hypothetical protein